MACTGIPPPVRATGLSGRQTLYDELLFWRLAVTSYYYHEYSLSRAKPPSLSSFSSGRQDIEKYTTHRTWCPGNRWTRWAARSCCPTRPWRTCTRCLCTSISAERTGELLQRCESNVEHRVGQTHRVRFTCMCPVMPNTCQNDHRNTVKLLYEFLKFS